MNLELSLRAVLDDDMLAAILTSDQTLAKAISSGTTEAGAARQGDTTAAAKVWSTIADGTADIGRVLVWSQHVAKNLKRDVIDSAKPPRLRGENAESKVRQQNALKAVQLQGRLDQHIAIRELFAALEGFENIDNPSEEETHKKWVGICRSHGLLSGLDDKQAYTLIRDIRQGKRCTGGPTKL